MRAQISLVERAVLAAISKCKTPQMRCLIKKARQLYPKWGLDKKDIIWGIRRLKKSGILTGRFGKKGQAAIFYRMANSLHQELDKTIHQAMAVGRRFKKLGYNKRRRAKNYRRYTYLAYKPGTRYPVGWGIGLTLKHLREARYSAKQAGLKFTFKKDKKIFKEKKKPCVNAEEIFT